MYIYTRVCPCVKCNLCVHVYVCVALSKMGFLSDLEEKGLALSPLLLPSQLWAGLKVPINLDGDGCHSSVLTLPLVSLFPVSQIWLLPFLGQRTSGRGFWLGVADPQRTSVLVQSPGHVGGTPWGLGHNRGTVAQSVPFPTSLWMGRASLGGGGGIANLNTKCKQFGWNPRTAV